MALYIIHTDGRYNMEAIWHVGESTTMNMPELSTITHIQADGDELEYIKELFRLEMTGVPHYTIPMPLDRSLVTWYGDFARTIIANL